MGALDALGEAVTREISARTQPVDGGVNTTESRPKIGLIWPQRQSRAMRHRNMAGGCPAFLLNIEKRSLPRLMLSGDGLASNDAV
jgi:hypothetical protein